MYYDAHNHFQDDWLRPYWEAMLSELPRLGVAGMVVNGTCVDDWQAVADLAAHAEWIIPGYGLHPWDAGNRKVGWLEALRERLLSDPKAAVGEIGIDKWILDRAKPDDPRLAGLRRAPIEEQLEVFHAQLDLACELDRAASIHCIDAWGLLHEQLRKRALPRRGFLLHAYAGPATLVEDFARLGAYFSFNGSFLEVRRHKTRDVYTLVPEDRVLVETDAPAMCPPAPWAPYPLPAVAGQSINHPANLLAIHQGLAELRQCSMEHLTRTCETNFKRLFTCSRASGS